MRLRNVPGAREVMVENEYVFTEPEGMKGTPIALITAGLLAMAFMGFSGIV